MKAPVTQSRYGAFVFRTTIAPVPNSPAFHPSIPAKTGTVPVCSVQPKGATVPARASGSLFLQADFIRGNFPELWKGKAKRDRMISKAVTEHRYSQMEVARHLKLHYSTISRLIKSVNQEQR